MNAVNATNDAMSARCTTSTMSTTSAASPADALAPAALPTFGFVTLHGAPLDDGCAHEDTWAALVASTGRPMARLWQGAPGLVVPRRTTQRPGWAAACAALAAAGRPVQVRASGGGLVPQGPGIWNLSLLWPSAQAVPQDTDALYRAFTAGLAAAFARLGIPSAAQPVEGSFCDGRYNLAHCGRKLVGTAQAWRRVAGVPIVLVHAVLIVTAEPQPLTDLVNHFDALCEGLDDAPPRYRAEALTSLAQAWRDEHPGQPLPADFEPELLRALAEQFARLVPPHEVAAAVSASPPVCGLAIPTTPVITKASDGPA